MMRRIFTIVFVIVLLCTLIGGCQKENEKTVTELTYPSENHSCPTEITQLDGSIEEEYVYYKPVIYLYPREITDIRVSLDLQGKLTCTYPAYREGWHVTAKPDGTLFDSSGQSYNYLYWEGDVDAQWDLSTGFCIAGEDTAAFLEKALAQLGLTRKEANEFIVFWLPLMEANPYNIITFQTDAYQESAKLNISPAPDTMIRIFMVWYPTDVPLEIPEQTLTAPHRNGFTVVEWGGTKI